MITQISHHIGIGEYGDFIDTDSIEHLSKEVKIKCIINLRKKPAKPEILEKYHELGIAYFHSPIITHPEKNRKQFIKECKKAIDILHERTCIMKERTIIYCTAGMDRSPFIVAKVLLKYPKNQAINKASNIRPTSLPEAYQIIKKQRPWIIEHHEWDWKECNICGKLLKDNGLVTSYTPKYPSVPEEVIKRINITTCSKACITKFLDKMREFDTIQEMARK